MAVKPNKEREARRKWCVEIAVKWPQVWTGGSGGMGVYMYADADIVGRARKLEDFILGNTDR